MKLKNKAILIIVTLIIIFFYYFYNLTIIKAIKSPYIYNFDNYQNSQSGYSSTRFFDEDQITSKNIGDLELVWSFKQKAHELNQSTPIFKDNYLYIVDPSFGIFKIDPGDSSIIWEHKLKKPVGKRGFLIAGSFIFIASQDGINVINTKDGSKAINFGNNGVIKDSFTLLSPIVYKNILYVASSNSTVKAFELPSGKKIWENNFSRCGAHNRLWSGFSFDKKNSQILVTTGNANDSLIWNKITCEEIYGPGIVALDPLTGKLLWFNKILNHDVWDLDATGHPIIFDTLLSRRIIQLTKSGIPIIVSSKTGEVLNARGVKKIIHDGVINLTDQTIWDSNFIFGKQIYDPNYELSDRSEESLNFMTNKLRHSIFKKHSIPTASNDVVLFGLHGGAEWPGGALDPIKNHLYVPYNNVPWILRTKYSSKNKRAIEKVINNSKKLKNTCISCHGSHLEGFNEEAILGDRYIPSLIGASLKFKYANFTDSGLFRKIHSENFKSTNNDISITDNELQVIWNHLSALDKKLENIDELNINGFWQYLLDENKLPASKPPWGGIVALDLENQKILWDIAIGKHPRAADINGDLNVGGIITTGSDIIFFTGTRDKKIYAINKKNGEIVWSNLMPFAGSAPPMTFNYKGCQMLMVNSTGGQFIDFGKPGNQIHAYKLNSCEFKN